MLSQHERSKIQLMTHTSAHDSVNAAYRDKIKILPFVFVFSVIINILVYKISHFVITI
jgi:hypothetical protein